MNPLDSFIHILEKQQETKLLPFLKELNPAQRKELVPSIKKLSKEYLEYKPFTLLSTTSFKIKASPTQEKILRIAAFFCFNLSDYKKNDSFGYTFSKNLIDRELLMEYCPDWFNEYVNEYGHLNYIPYQLNYDYVMELADQGFVVPQKELLVKLIPQSIYQQQHNTYIWEYKPEHLHKRKVTLQEHIWYLFELESTINSSHRYMQFHQPSNGDSISWIDTFVTLVDQGHISRERLLKEALLATSKNFNKTLSGWFAQLFIALAPTVKELLCLQNELFITFNSPHSKPVSTSLQYVKKLADEEQFNSKAFLDNISLLLSSETKTIVSSALIILEKLAKKQTQLREEICQATCQAFIHREEELQSKAANLIQRYGDTSSYTLQDILFQYYGYMLSNAKNILESFICKAKTEIDDNQIFSELFQPRQLLVDERQIKPVKNIDDLVFLVSQAFDHNASYHVDILPAALVHLQNEIKGENIAKLAPAFQRAYKLVMEGWNSQTGYLDHMLATFFIDYGKLLVKRFPREAKLIKELHEKYTAKDEGFKIQWSFYNLRIGTLRDWKTYNSDTLYEPYKKILLAALNKIETGCTLPLLSTPTHEPGWIAPTTLINRLSKYQHAGLMPNGIDFQVAIARCAFENIEEALQQADAQLSGEYSELIKFLFIKASKPLRPITQHALWMVAALTKCPQKVYEEINDFSCQKLPKNFLTGQHPWKTIVEAYSYDWYDYTKRSTVKVHDTRKILQIDLEATLRKQTGLNTVIKFFTKKNEDEKLFYEYFKIKGQYFSVEHNDIQRLLLLSPHHPEPLLAQIAHKCLKYPSFGEEGDKKMLIKTLECLLEIWEEFGEMAHLFVSTSMLSADKAVRSYAAEIWIAGVHTNMIHSDLVGEIIGKHESIEFAPLKRLTDLINSNMFGLSEKHNYALESLLTAILTQLPDTPIHQLKKLLQIYTEVLSINKSSINNAAIVDQLAKWKSITSLHKVIAILEEKMSVATEMQLDLI